MDRLTVRAFDKLRDTLLELAEAKLKIAQLEQEIRDLQDARDSEAFDRERDL